MDKQQAIEWLKSFLHEVDTQDNRATAKPILFLLQTKEEYVSKEGYGWRTRRVYRHSEMEGDSLDRQEEVVEWLKEYGYSGESLEKEIENIEEFEMGHYWKTQQVFFTEKAVKKHLELNGHNYRKEHRDYVIHAFRNPEIKELFEVIKAITEPTEQEG